MFNGTWCGHGHQDLEGKKWFLLSMNGHEMCLFALDFIGDPPIDP